MLGQRYVCQHPVWLVSGVIHEPRGVTSDVRASVDRKGLIKSVMTEMDRNDFRVTVGKTKASKIEFVLKERWRGVTGSLDRSVRGDWVMKVCRKTIFRENDRPLGYITPRM